MRTSIASFADSQTLPACSDKYSVKVNMGVECLWSDTDGGNRSVRTISWSIATLFTTSIRWTCPGSNRIPAVRGRRPAWTMVRPSLRLIPHTSQRTHPVPIVTNSGLMLFNEIIGFCYWESYEIREFNVLRIVRSFRIMQQVVWMPSSLVLNRVAPGW